MVGQENTQNELAGSAETKAGILAAKQARERETRSFRTALSFARAAAVQCSGETRDVDLLGLVVVHHQDGIDCRPGVLSRPGHGLEHVDEGSSAVRALAFEGSKFSLESVGARRLLKIAEHFSCINDDRAHGCAHKRVDVDTAIQCLGFSEFGMTAFLSFFDTRLANPPPSSARSLSSQNRSARFIKDGTASVLRLRAIWTRPGSAI
jgi:hypothetical protein